MVLGSCLWLSMSHLDEDIMGLEVVNFGISPGLAVLDDALCSCGDISWDFFDASIPGDVEYELALSKCFCR